MKFLTHIIVDISDEIDDGFDHRFNCASPLRSVGCKMKPYISLLQSNRNSYQRNNYFLFQNQALKQVDAFS